MKQKLKLAILDLYDGTPNQGMRAIKNIVRLYEHTLDWQVFDVRTKCELPDTSFDLYIASGGPGDPLDGDGVWDRAFFQLIDQLWTINRTTGGPRKFVFFICHSFQMACLHFGLAEVTLRRSRSFGTFPVHKVAAGKQEHLFNPLPDPFYVADFRKYQMVQPDMDRFKELGAELLALEKFRPHVPLERAVMAVRFSDEFFGTQFHPEADPEGMMIHFSQESLKHEIKEEHGEEKFEQMMKHLNDREKISLTHQTILPTFLDHAIEVLQMSLVSV